MRRNASMPGAGVLAASGLLLLATLLATLGAAPNAAVQESFAERRARIEQMTPAEKSELDQKFLRFRQLDEAEQERMRRLHADLAAAPDDPPLLGVLVRYSEWLKSLQSGERAELAALEPEARVARIRQLQESQRFKRLVATRLTPEDVQAVFRWLEEYATRYEAELVAALPEEGQRRIRAETDPGRRRRTIMYWLPRREPGKAIPAPSGEDVARLYGQLSADARTALDGLPDTARKVAIVHEWARGAVFSRMTPIVSQDDLRRFFTQDLTPQDRERIVQMPPEQMQQELRRLYFTHRFRRWSSGDDKPPWQDRHGGGRGTGGGPSDDRRGPGPGGPPDDRRGPGPGGGPPRPPQP
jgi:hypothetical protein